MKILVTGAAGFIGFHVSKKLLERGDDVVGFDNMNDYYDPALKQARVDLLVKLLNNKREILILFMPTLQIKLLLISVFRSISSIA